VMLDLIEDDDAVRLSTMALFESYGLKIRSHASARTFLSVYKTSDCLLVNQHMPGLKGLDLIAKLREAGDNTPAILITGCESALIYRRAAAYAVPVVVKPVRFDDLIEEIESVCRAFVPAD